MSKDIDMTSSDEAVAVSKKERREKKEKKEKKDKKRSKSESKPQTVEADASDDAAAAAETPAKKRKRDILPEELEIDVNLPEPASKKAARKAKKAKLNPAPTADGDGAEASTKTDGEAKGNNDTDGKRSAYGVWIGNLPWSATKDSLRTFLADNSEIASDQITRVHMPPPTKVNPSWTTKPLNKGFAYVDFSTELAMYSAIALTETKMDGRALLIKNAKSFEGRPDKPKTEEGQDGRRGANTDKSGHPPNKRVFIGNLSFDVTKEDLQEHYAQCGEIEDIHVATFEDSGKCKGYAWITFADVDAATWAVKGFIFKDPSEFKKKNKKDESDDDDDAEDAKPEKKRKWFINKFMGRELRCEFAEDATTRYNKRWGKDRPVKAVDGVNPDRWRNFDQGGGSGDRKSGRPNNDRGGHGSKRKVDPRTIKSGAAHSSAPRASQAIVESQGKKTTFD
jgi:RNA recognition motif-containing protein